MRTLRQDMRQLVALFVALTPGIVFFGMPTESQAQSTTISGVTVHIHGKTFQLWSPQAISAGQTLVLAQNPKPGSTPFNFDTSDLEVVFARSLRLLVELPHPFWGRVPPLLFQTVPKYWIHTAVCQSTLRLTRRKIIRRLGSSTPLVCESLCLLDMPMMLMLMPAARTFLMVVPLVFRALSMVRRLSFKDQRRDHPPIPVTIRRLEVPPATIRGSFCLRQR